MRASFWTLCWNTIRVGKSQRDTIRPNCWSEGVRAARGRHDDEMAASMADCRGCGTTRYPFPRRHRECERFQGGGMSFANWFGRRTPAWSPYLAGALIGVLSMFTFVPNLHSKKEMIDDHT